MVMGGSGVWCTVEGVSVDGFVSRCGGECAGSGLAGTVIMAGCGAGNLNPVP